MEERNNLPFTQNSVYQLLSQKVGNHLHGMEFFIGKAAGSILHRSKLNPRSLDN